MWTGRFVAIATGIAIPLLLISCRKPIESRWAIGDENSSLESKIARAIALEIQSLDLDDSSESAKREFVHSDSDVLRTLADRRDELESIGPLGTSQEAKFDLGSDLTGNEQIRFDLAIEDAIATAVANNLGVQQARLQPQISAEELLSKQAIFDFLVFGSVDLTKTDQPQRVPVIGGNPLGTPFLASEHYRFETGLRKKLSSGAEVTVSTDLERFRNTSPGISFSPDPGYTSAVRVGITQPLLRGFGSDVNKLAIYLSENELKRTEDELRDELLQLVVDTETAYWDLVFAWNNLAINEWLVEVGIGVKNVLDRRREFDTTLAQYSDAVARVEQRRADVIRARREVRASSDRLKILMNNADALIASEVVLFPQNQPVETPIHFQMREAILTSLDHRPEVKQAALTIDDAMIRQRAAENDKLPRADFEAQVAAFGLAGDASDSYDLMSEGSFIDYVLGLDFEYPLGNRAAHAEARKSRLEQSSSILAYQRTIRDVIQDVKSALRDVIANYELIQATRSFRVAQAENLRTLHVEEETKVGLTPEFLNLKFTRQETLASARQQELQAVVNFAKSVAQLHRSMGTGLNMNQINLEVYSGEDPEESH